MKSCAWLPQVTANRKSQPVTLLVFPQRSQDLELVTLHAELLKTRKMPYGPEMHYDACPCRSFQAHQTKPSSALHADGVVVLGLDY